MPTQIKQSTHSQPEIDEAVGRIPLINNNIAQLRVDVNTTNAALSAIDTKADTAIANIATAQSTANSAVDCCNNNSQLISATNNRIDLTNAQVASYAGQLAQALLLAPDIAEAKTNARVALQEANSAVTAANAAEQHAAAANAAVAQAASDASTAIASTIANAAAVASLRLDLTTTTNVANSALSTANAANLAAAAAQSTANTAVSDAAAAMARAILADTHAGEARTVGSNALAATVINAAAIDALDVRVTAHDQLVPVLQQSLLDVINDVTAVTTLANQAKTIGQNAGTAAAAADAKAVIAQDCCTTNSGLITALTTRVGANETTLAGYGTRLSTVEGVAAAANTTANAARDTANAADAASTTNASAIAALTPRVTACETSCTAAMTAATTADGKAVAAQASATQANAAANAATVAAGAAADAAAAASAAAATADAKAVTADTKALQAADLAVAAMSAANSKATPAYVNQQDAAVLAQSRADLKVLGSGTGWFADELPDIQFYPNGIDGSSAPAVALYRTNANGDLIPFKSAVDGVIRMLPGDEAWIETHGSITFQTNFYGYVWMDDTDHLRADRYLPSFDVRIVAYVIVNRSMPNSFVYEGNELHLASRNSATHAVLHKTMGLGYVGGGNLMDDYTDRPVREIAITEVQMHDEDLFWHVQDGIPSIDTAFEQILDPLTAPVLLRNQNTGQLYQSQPMAGFLPQYERNPGNVTDIPVDKFGNAFLCVTADERYPVKWILGTAAYNSAEGCLVEKLPSVLARVPEVPEIFCLFRVVFEHIYGEGAHVAAIIEVDHAGRYPNDTPNHSDLSGRGEVNAHPSRSIWYYTQPGVNVGQISTVEQALNKLYELILWRRFPMNNVTTISRNGNANVFWNTGMPIGLEQGWYEFQGSCSYLTSSSTAGLGMVANVVLANGSTASQQSKVSMSLTIGQTDTTPSGVNDMLTTPSAASSNYGRVSAGPGVGDGTYATAVVWQYGSTSSGRNQYNFSGRIYCAVTGERFLLRLFSAGSSASYSVTIQTDDTPTLFIRRMMF